MLAGEFAQPMPEGAAVARGARAMGALERIGASVAKVELPEAVLRKAEAIRALHGEKGLADIMREYSERGVPLFSHDLPMDDASRMARAQEMGLGQEAMHGTNQDFYAFDNSKIGMANDPGFSGTGHYAVRYGKPNQYPNASGAAGEASYYGKNLVPLNVPEAHVNMGGNGTLGVQGFTSWAKKLDNIGALDQDTKAEYLKMLEIEKQVDEIMGKASPVSGNPYGRFSFVSPKGEVEYIEYDGKPNKFLDTWSGRPAATKEEALDALRYEVTDNLARDINARASYSDYMRLNPGANDRLSNAVAERGGNQLVGGMK